MPAAIATAVGTPALHAMGAAPGAVVEDLCLPLRRKTCEKLTIVCEDSMMVLFDPVHCIAECHFAVAMMVSVALSVGSDVYELRFVSRFIGFEVTNQALAKFLAGVQQAFKSNGTGCRAVVEEHCDGTTLIELYQVGMRRIDGGIERLDPREFVWAGTVGTRRGLFAQRPDACALMRGKNGEANAFLRHQVEDLA